MFFKSPCSQVNIQPLELLLWVHTRWASLYKFFDRILQLRKVCHFSFNSFSGLSLCLFMQGIDQFVLLVDASDKVPDLPKNRSYANFQLTKKDWDHLEEICNILRVRGW
jgi:hypothetical protein